MGFAPIWLLAFLFALPSCFEVSCIKLVGCELFADDSSTDANGDDDLFGSEHTSSEAIQDALADFEISDFVIE